MRESKPRDLHHILYPATSYMSPEGLKLREHHLMIVRLPISTHIDLHRQLEPSCIPLNDQTAAGVYHEINQLESSSHIGPLELVDILARWFKNKGVPGLAANLMDQQEFFNEATHMSAHEFAKRHRQQVYHNRAGGDS